jgi:hypothetical protein
MPKLKLEIQEEEVERLTLSLRKTTLERLRAYKAFNEARLNGKLTMNYFVERILNTLISDDKDFVLHEKQVQRAEKAAAPAKSS